MNTWEAQRRGDHLYLLQDEEIETEQIDCIPASPPHPGWGRGWGTKHGCSCSCSVTHTLPIRSRTSYSRSSQAEQKVGPLLLSWGTPWRLPLPENPALPSPRKPVWASDRLDVGTAQYLFTRSSSSFHWCLIGLRASEEAQARPTKQNRHPQWPWQSKWRGIPGNLQLSPFQALWLPSPLPVCFRPLAVLSPGRGKQTSLTEGFQESLSW